ncbi:MAG: tRNA dihydrouridine synthase DusB [Pleomorphochaeta sp.]
MDTSKLYHPIKIKDLTIDGNLFLAPLAGYTDIPFRYLCKKHGANLTTSEMVSTEGIARGNEKTVNLMKRAENEDLFVIQIFTDNLDSLQRGFEALLKFNPTIIDINCGCPVPKVTKTGAGSALMQTPEKMAALVNFIHKNSDIPVSVKFRTGWDSENENYLDFAKLALDNGASSICMHARTKTQGYMPTAHWDRLENLTKVIHEEYKGIPIFGSGDLFEPKDGLRMLSETNVDGLMFARGAIGNPFIFEQTRHLLQTGEDIYPSSVIDRVDIILEQLDLMCQIYREDVAYREMRKHCCAYLKGINGSAKVKQLLMKANSKKDYIEALSLLS